MLLCWSPNLLPLQIFSSDQLQSQMTSQVLVEYTSEKNILTSCIPVSINTHFSLMLSRDLTVVYSVHFGGLISNKCTLSIVHLPE